MPVPSSRNPADSASPQLGDRRILPSRTIGPGKPRARSRWLISVDGTAPPHAIASKLVEASVPQSLAQRANSFVDEPLPDVDIEELLTLTQATKYFPLVNGRRIHVATLYTYTTKGKWGVVLASVQAGDVRCTTRAAIAKFFAELTEKKNLRPVVPSASQAEAEAAQQRLAQIFGRNSSRAVPK